MPGLKSFRSASVTLEGIDILGGIDLSVGPVAALSAVLGALAVGTIILGKPRNGLTLMKDQAFYQLLAMRIIIIVAVAQRDRAAADQNPARTMRAVPALRKL